MATNQQIEQGIRLREARVADRRFSSAAQAAEALGIPTPTYQAHENGNRGFGSNAQRYADFYRVNLEWLLTGRGAMKGSASTSAPSSPDQGKREPGVTMPEFNLHAMPRDVPILGSGACGENGMFEMNGQVLDHARRPPRLAGVKDAYALWVAGDSMVPWRKNGGLVFVHPHQPVNIGDFVVVQLKQQHDGEPIAAYIKQLVRRTAKDLRLAQFNPAQELVIPSSRVSSIHRILEMEELFSL